MDGVGEPYELVLVNDGSRDKTVPLAKEICSNDSSVKLIDFSRNFGHQTAITAGMDYASGDAIIVIDADLQDPPEVIPEMIAKWREGYEVVYGQRTKRKGETFFKKFTAREFYRTLNKMTDVDMPVDTGDFRLIDRKVADALKNVGEHNRYVRGIVSWLGFKTCPVEFERDKRFAGETKYPLKKMLKLASDGIMSFSYKPLKWATGCGIFTALAAFIYLIVMIIVKACGGMAGVPWWTVILVIAVMLIGGVLIALGIIGEYMARIYEEAKGRPLYVVRDLINFPEDTKLSGR